MDPQLTPQDTPKQALPSVTDTPEETPSRILEILRSIQDTQQQVPPQTEVPVVVPHTPSIPTLADLGGTRPATAGSVTAEPEMAVYKPDFSMESITLEAGEPKNPKSFSTSLASDKVSSEPIVTSGADRSEFIIPSVHTLRDDMKNVVRDQSMTIVRASVLEDQKKRTRAEAQQKITEENTRGERKKQGSFSGIVVAIFVFLSLGAALAGAFLWYRSTQQDPITVPSEIPGVVFAEQTIGFSLSNTSPTVLKSGLSNARESAMSTPGSITRLVPTVTPDSSLGGSGETRLATMQELFDALDIAPPEGFLRSVGNESFLGIHATDGNHVLFIIPVTSYERAFSSMLAWEETMSEALAPFFPRGLDSSPSSFTDIVIKNYDVRMQSDASGTPRLMYMFPNRNFLIITSSPYTLIEALARLQAARKL